MLTRLYPIRKVFVVLAIFVTVFAVSGCDLDIVVDRGGDDLGDAISRITEGVLDIIDIFD